MIRKEIFKEGSIYHILNKTISGFKIFTDDKNAKRFLEILDYYNNQLNEKSFSKFIEINEKYEYKGLLIPKELPQVKYLSFSIMPTHYHLLLKILNEKDFSRYIGNSENSFVRYFNIKYKRKGPLWESRFKAVRIKTQEQLLHVSRYIHLNPVTNYLVEKPEYWKFSSYCDFLSNKEILGNIIKEIPILNLQHFKVFTENQISYQRKLKLIKKLILE